MVRPDPEKDPSLRLFALASTNLTENTYTGVRYRYETGGRERSGSQTVTSRARNHQLALELTHQINPSNQIQLQYIHDLKVENGPHMRRRADALCLRILGTGS